MTETSAPAPRLSAPQRAALPSSQPGASVLNIELTGAQVHAVLVAAQTAGFELPAETATITARVLRRKGLAAFEIIIATGEPITVLTERGREWNRAFMTREIAREEARS